ncbi:MarR family winged helix-turn-helix transcriptional regulator [Nocardia sp. NBC_00565]|uniref:MarR family winged helix-turn-helix transcriptional regulator n=1 Tax=Nocardia sp. NBC_00565 TaxID=2975993 RepID=UPI002E8185BE|nr:MarR family winged helix-turn-helix transcriptional regulator [Nocardia sp. NBC_00565]WUB99784.1 MarR family winged helix-turn-helix transcriptional regulator [Nocardia sp. NBC_00565]
MEEHDAVTKAVEAAMVRIRRRQTRGALGKDSPVPIAVFRVLDAVADSGAATVGTLAPTLGVDQPRASRLVAQAVSSGHLERVADQHDGRRTVLRLTPAGQDVVAAARDGRRTAMAAAMSDWTDRERKEFARLLARFVDALDDRDYSKTIT